MVLWLNVRYGWQMREWADRRTGTVPSFAPEAERQAEIAVLRERDPEAILPADKGRLAAVKAAVVKPVEEKAASGSLSPGSRRESQNSDHKHGEEDHGEPTILVSPAPVRGVKERRETEGSATGGRPAASRTNTLSRQPTRASTGEMPDIQQVLSRTISLTGGSVHGGG